MNYVLIMLSWGVWCGCYEPHEIAIFPNKEECEKAGKAAIESTLIGEARTPGKYVCGIKRNESSPTASKKEGSDG